MGSVVLDHDNVSGTASLWRPWALATASAVIVNVLISRLALRFLPIARDFGPLKPGPIVFWTLVGVAGATGVFAIVRRRAARPRSRFLAIAAVTLVISFIPDALLLSARYRARFPGTGPLSVGVLMLLHVTTAAITVGLLLSRARRTRAV